MFVKWSDIGKYHVEHNKENEDALFSVKRGDGVAVALCDGVSTCENAGQGARVACESLCDFFVEKGHKLLGYDKSTIAKKTISHILYDLKKTADAEGKNIESFSSTAVCVFHDEISGRLLCINIGDGMVIGVGDGVIEVIMKSQKGCRGCYVTTTRGVERVADVKIMDAKRYDSICICSDGMWKQLFCNDLITEEAEKYLKDMNYNGLISYVQDMESMDDRSFVAMDIKLPERIAS